MLIKDYCCSSASSKQFVSPVSLDADCIEFTETPAALIEMYRDMTERIKERCDMLEERNRCRV